MLIHPQFNPVAIAIGPLAVHWYGLMYLLAFAQFWWLGRYQILRRQPTPAITPAASENASQSHNWTIQQLDDLLFYGMLGVIVGGRLGQVLFYEPMFYLQHPLEIFALWKGGMSFHGGFIGVLLALALYARRLKRPWLALTDFIAPLVPLGLAAGRLGNFINGELWGRVADPSLPWAMIFPQVDSLPRHPSQLYQAALEGIILFLILWCYARRARPRGAVSAVFLLGYGSFRFIAEYFRSPDDGIFGFSYVMSMGQWLSLPMIVLGLLMLFFIYRPCSQERS
ncbi:MAG: prolipoprotein diacylglyceryl transferase [Pseudomonadota bacterium]